MWNHRNDLPIRQQFRADFRMTPDRFLDTFTLVRNKLRKTRHSISWSFSNWKESSDCFQKQLPEPKFTEKTPATGKRLCQSIFFNKVAGLRPATLFKKRLWHRCFPKNFAKFLTTLFWQNTSGRLLLWRLGIPTAKLQKHLLFENWLW